MLVILTYRLCREVFIKLNLYIIQGSWTYVNNASVYCKWNALGRWKSQRSCSNVSSLWRYLRTPPHMCVMLYNSVIIINSILKLLEHAGRWLSFLSLFVDDAVAASEPCFYLFGVSPALVRLYWLFRVLFDFLSPSAVGMYDVADAPEYLSHMVLWNTYCKLDFRWCTAFRLVLNGPLPLVHVDKLI